MALRRIDAFDTANAEKLADQLSRLQDNVDRELAGRARIDRFSDWVSKASASARYEEVLRLDTSVNAVRVALPSVSLATAGLRVGILLVGANAATLEPVESTATIDGAATATLSSEGLRQYEHDGFQWYQTSSGSGGGSGDFVGPAGAVADNFVSFDGVTGKLGKDSGYSASSFATAAQLLERWHVAIVGGSGIDGDLTASSGTTTLTKATHYRNVTLSGTAKINTNGWPLYIQVLDVTAAGDRAIYAPGTDSPGSGAVGPTVKSGSLLGGGGDGTTGAGGGAVNTVGNAGTSPTGVAVGMGGIGGKGGAGGAGNGGKAGGAGAAGASPTLRVYLHSIDAFFLAATNAAGTSLQVVFGGSGGGSGGGGGGSDVGTGNAGGGAGSSGSGGPVMLLSIGELITGASTPARVFDAYGGAGSNAAGVNPGGGGGGGGAGGGGGGLLMKVGKRTGSAVTDLACATGGAGGTGRAATSGGVNGAGGAAGGGGQIYAALLSTGAHYAKAHESSGPAGIGTAGGVPTVWGVTF